jgi:hypothetical protein
MFCILKKYRDIFGIPGKGVHRFKFEGTSIIDYILTFIVAILTTSYTKIPLVLTTIIWFLIGILLHIIFGVNTSTLKYLNIKC